MKIGLAVSTVDALPSAYVVYRDDLCRCIERCADLGYDGAELALRNASQVDVQRIKQRLAATGLEIPCISTGQVFAADQLDFNNPDVIVRDPLLLARDFIGYIHVADSNRLAPGWGHIPFDEIFGVLGDIGYNDWITVEILPDPDPDSAAQQAIQFLRSRFAAQFARQPSTVA